MGQVSFQKMDWKKNVYLFSIGNIIEDTISSLRIPSGKPGRCRSSSFPVSHDAVEDDGLWMVLDPMKKATSLGVPLEFQTKK